MAKLYLLGFILIHGFQVTAQQPDTSFNSSLRLINNLYRELSAHYVDSIDKDELTASAINGMLNKLDPWSFFLSKKAADLERARWNNKFGGIGISFRQIDDETVVTKLTKGSPADMAGLQCTDIIVSVDGKQIKGWKQGDIVYHLRGEPGSKLTIMYKRKGNLFSTTLTRDIITISSVPYYGMVDEHTGYIFTDAMTETTGEDVKLALLELKKNPQLRGLVIDLRDNGGGRIQAAFDIAGLFLPKGTKTMSQKGRTLNEWFATRNEPVDMNIPLTLLIGRNTASASEILCGIMQDYDRAVLIGGQTYGKAMTQKIYALGGGNEASVTQAYYYTPSGRCIQVKTFKNGVAINPPDSVVKIFKTKNGRPVKSNNAIVPDITMEPRRLPWLAGAAFDTNQFYKFAAVYKSKNPQIPPASEFSLPDIEFNEFYQSILNGKYSYVTPGERKLEELKETLKRSGEWEDTEQAYLLMKQSIRDYTKKELEAGKREVKNWLEREICGMYYFNTGYIEAAIKDDPMLAKAKEVLSDQNQYKAILRIR